MTGARTGVAPTSRPRRLPPGPSRAMTAQLLSRMARDRLAVMTSVAGTYGDAVRLPLGPKTLLFFNHPDHAKHVLTDNHSNYHKGIGLVHARRALGDGLLTSEGELWRSQRRTIQPVFQAKRIARQTGVIGEEALKLVARLRERETGGFVDIRAAMTGLTLGVLGRTLLDADLDAFDTIGESFEAVQDQAIFDMMSLGTVPAWLPLARQRRFRRARAELDRIVAHLATERAAHPGGDGDDVLSRLVESTRRDRDPAAGRRRMRDELVTLLLAGHETTASTLSWAFHLLDEHPLVWERVHREVTEVLGGRLPTAEDLHRLTYTTMVIEEVMRLYPPVWILPRAAQAADEIGGFRVPAGADVLICPYTLHRHPAFWDAPDRFDPERFAPDRSSGRHRYAYVPFGAGPRFCVGNNLGMLEATVVLATVVRELRLTKAPGHVVRPEPMLTLRVRGGLPMSVRSVV
ncbi:cytochrome P450 [Streptomyces sp. R302]|uniref:cytochrome P450 n=1 Tax=unclassified Streptomyces TaxID=2593676 RepID=UPI00145C5325|nr:MULTISPECIES: cytochrome P450 [unclassified Streptomyces]NML50985.1 cytochrome P450 [Streptomyces sp. R301]NML81079.1 cytochrome P450 [Streptomyces sp. R302]